MAWLEGSQSLTHTVGNEAFSTFCKKRNSNGLMDENEEKKIVDDD